MKETKKCPYCAEEININAILCKHCKQDINSLVKKDIQDSKSNNNWFSIVIFGIIAIIFYFIFFRETPESQCEDYIKKLSVFNQEEMTVEQCTFLYKSKPKFKSAIDCIVDIDNILDESELKKCIPDY